MAATNLPVHPNQPPRLMPRQDLQIREDVLYADAKGNENARIRERAEQALDSIVSVLRKFLLSGEVIFYVSRGSLMPDLFEQFTSGIWSHLQPGALLVFTNRRLLNLRLKSKGFRSWEWDGGVEAMFWGDVDRTKVASGLSPYVELRDRKGHKERFWRLRRADVKKIRMLLAAFLPASAGETTPDQSFTSYCPSCCAALTPGVYRCAGCGMEFKDEKTLVWRGILIPGGADFYARRTARGVLIFLLESALLFTFLFWLLIFVGAVSPPTPDPGQTAQARADFLAPLIFLAVIIALEKSMAIRIGLRMIRRFLPLRKPEVPAI